MTAWLIGDRVRVAGHPGTVVRYNAGDYLVFLDEPVGYEDTAWATAEDLVELDE